MDDLTVKILRLKASYRPCGVDTVKKDYTEIRINTAKVMALTAQLVSDGKTKENLQKSLQTAKSQSAHRLYFLIGLILVIVIYLVFRIYEFFAGGGLISGLLGLKS